MKETDTSGIVIFTHLSFCFVHIIGVREKFIPLNKQVFLRISLETFLGTDT